MLAILPIAAFVAATHVAQAVLFQPIAEEALTTRYQSDVRVRKPCVMLVGIEPGEEPEELGLRELACALHVVRVRRPLPACHRMLILRPVVVIVGPAVREWSFPLLDGAAREIDAALLVLGPLVVRAALRDWLRRVLEAVLQRRAGGQRFQQGRSA